MQKTPVQPQKTVLQGEFVDNARGAAQSMWQQRQNGSGFTFRTELTQLEGRLEQKFTGLHHHLSQHHNISQQVIEDSFGGLEERVIRGFYTIDRKLNALLAAQRAQASRRLTMWLMGVLAVSGVYVIVVHPMLRPVKPVVPTMTQVAPQMPTPAPIPTPNVPLPNQIPAN